MVLSLYFYILSGVSEVLHLPSCSLDDLPLVTEMYACSAAGVEMYEPSFYPPLLPWENASSH